jgi:tetratricopeptide (TPR) repeat protein
MSPKPTDGKPLTLQLVDDTPGGGPVSRAPDGAAPAEKGKSGRDLRITTADEFLTAAAQEYEKGQLDDALWARSTAQAGGDESLAIAAYLRARATSLQLARREQQQRDKPAGPAPGAATPSDAAPAVKAAAAPGRAEAARMRIDSKLLYAGAAAAALAVVLVTWLLLSSRHDDAPNAIAAASSAAPPAVKRVAAEPPAVVAAQPSEPSLEARVTELGKAKNWNVLVLYAVEWTRKEPSNAAAWNALSTGYSNLRQHAEALDAANKAVALAPSDAAYLRTLGNANLALDRFPEAGAAFDRALAVTADDVDALCGAAEVAQKEGRARDADAFARRASAANGQCAASLERPAFAPATAARKSASAR